MKLTADFKFIMSYQQGNVGSQVYIDAGSCVSDLGFSSCSGLDFDYTSINKPDLAISRTQMRMTNVSDFVVTVKKDSKEIGFITFENMFDKNGPDGRTQLSPQILVRDKSMKALCEPYKPKELHTFSLEDGPINSLINLGKKEIFKQKFLLKL